MQLDELLARLRENDISLRRKGSELVVIGNEDALTATLVSELRTHKRSLLDMLAQGSAAHRGSAR